MSLLIAYKDIDGNEHFDNQQGFVKIAKNNLGGYDLINSNGYNIVRGYDVVTVVSYKIYIDGICIASDSISKPDKEIKSSDLGISSYDGNAVPNEFSTEPNFVRDSMSPKRLSGGVGLTSDELRFSKNGYKYAEPTTTRK